MNTLKIVATIVTKAEYKAELEKVFKKLVDETRKEAGNISYKLHNDFNNPLTYIFIEEWKDEQAIDFHNSSPHFQYFLQAVDQKVDKVEVNIIKEIY